MIEVPTCKPNGFDGRTMLVDEYYSWNDEPTGKVFGFVFWFEECFDPPTYFVPVEPTYWSNELPLQDALEAWIDYLYERKSGHIIGGDYEGSQTFSDYARECDDLDLERLTFGASFYAIESESWQCRESYIKADGLSS
jgi:hypothetical protein